MLKDNIDYIKMQHNLNFIATKNAIGQMFVKNYKYIDAFKKEESIELSEDEYQNIKNDLDW